MGQQFAFKMKRLILIIAILFAMVIVSSAQSATIDSINYSEHSLEQSAKITFDGHKMIIKAYIYKNVFEWDSISRICAHETVYFAKDKLGDQCEIKASQYGLKRAIEIKYESAKIKIYYEEN